MRAAIFGLLLLLAAPAAADPPRATNPPAWLHLSDGTAAAPSLTFALDMDTGIYRSGENTMELVTGGATRLTIGAVHVTASGNVNAGGFVGSGLYASGEGVARHGVTVNGKNASYATTTLTGGVDLGHTFYLSTDFGAADKVLQWGDAGTVELGAVFGDGSMQIDGDLTVDGGNILNAGSAAGINLTIASGADAAGDYGVVVGTNSTSTDGTIFAAATDIDGTPAYAFSVLGIGNAGVGVAPAADTRLKIGGAALASAGVAYGMTNILSLDPASGASAISLEIDPMITATAAETNPALYGLYIDGFTKTGTGTVTASYGIFVGTTTLATTNIGISTTAPIQFQRIMNTTVTAAVTCTAGYEGTQIYVDDTDDLIPGFMCMCGRGGDNVTYAWSKMNSNPAVACF